MTPSREALTIGRTPAEAASRADKPRWPIADFPELRRYGRSIRTGQASPKFAKISGSTEGGTVNTAKRMESYGLPDHVHVSAATRQALGDAFRFEPRGALDVKGKGSMQTFLLYRKS